MRVRRILKAIVLAAVASAVVATGALAYFHASGSGSTSGSVAVSLQPLTLTSAAPTAQLYPGGAADVALTVSNANTSRLHIASLVLDTSQGTGGFAVDASHAGCAVSALQFTNQTNGGSGWTVPAKSGATNGSLAIDLPAAISMSAGAANACQGASFTVSLNAGS